MTDTPKAVEVNCTTGEVTERPLTQEEIAQMEADRVAAEARKAEEDAAAKASADLKASAQAKLAKLGLTDAEISVLVG
jgi:membrane protein involved in colicin uptake